MTVFFILIIGVGWVFGQALGDPSILYIAIIFSLVMNIVSYWYSDKIVLRMNRARPADGPEFLELNRIVENLAITAGLPKPSVYIIDEAAPNAFATGRDPKHAVVAVTRGLMAQLDRSELEGVLAHELSHIGNRDMLVSTVAVVLAGCIAIVSDMFLRAMWWGGGRRSNDNRGGSAIFLVLGIVAAILAPLAASLIQLAISRKREFVADSSGALLTRYPEGLASALTKIAKDRTPMRIANNATAHLWLEDPFNDQPKTNWFHKLFMTHPPVEERVRALQGMDIK